MCGAKAVQGRQTTQVEHLVTWTDTWELGATYLWRTLRSAGGAHYKPVVPEDARSHCDLRVTHL